MSTLKGIPNLYFKVSIVYIFNKSSSKPKGDTLVHNSSAGVAACDLYLKILVHPQVRNYFHCNSGSSADHQLDICDGLLQQPDQSCSGVDILSVLCSNGECYLFLMYIHLA